MEFIKKRTFKENMKPVLILPFAELDIIESINHYNDQKAGLGIEYLNAIDESFIAISKNPKASPIEKYDIRKFIVNRFPFSIFYVNRTTAVYFSRFS